MKPAHSIQEYLDVIRKGITALPIYGQKADGRQKKIVIVGAGVAGLVAGYELKRAGHNPVILEGQQRVGGRVYT